MGKVLAEGGKNASGGSKNRPPESENEAREGPKSSSGGLRQPLGRHFGPGGRREAPCRGQKIMLEVLGGAQEGKNKSMLPPRQKREAKMAPKRPPGEAPGRHFWMFFGDPAAWRDFKAEMC